MTREQMREAADASWGFGPTEKTAPAIDWQAEATRLRRHLHAIHGGIYETADELRLWAKQALEGEEI